MARTIGRLAAATVLGCCSLAFAVSEVQTNVDVEAGPAADVRGTLAGETDVFRFAADAGAKLTFRVTASPARSLRFDVHLFAPTGGEVPIAAAPRFVNRRGFASLTGFALPETGRYALRVGGTGSGTYRLTWTAGSAAGKPQKLDVRCVPLARTPGAETAVCRPASTGRTTWVGAAPASDLAGAFVLLPADAAPAGTPVLMTSAAAPGVPDAAVRQAAGPALSVAPEGLVLAAPATVTVPYDPFLVPRGADAASVLSVARVESDGTSVALAAVAVDTQRHTVTVLTDRFSRFVASAPMGPLDPTGKSYWYASMEVVFTPSGDGDSRQRDVFLRAGRETFAPGGSLAREQMKFQGQWRHDDSGHCSGIIWGHPDDRPPAGWDFAPDGRRIDVAEYLSAPGAYEMSANGQALVGQLPAGDEAPSCRIAAAVLRSDLAPTMKELAGRYWVGVAELDMSWGRPQPLGLEVGRTMATLTLRTNGTWSLAADARSTRFASQSRKVSRTAFAGTVGGRWSVVGPGEGWAEGSVKLTAPGAVEPFVIRAFPSADRRSFVGATEPSGGFFLFLYGVRRSSSLTYAATAGEFAATEMELAVETYRVPPSGSPQHVVPDVRLVQSDARMRFGGSASLDVTSGAHRSVERDPAAPDGVRAAWETDPAGPPIPFTLTRAGSITVSVDPHVLVVGAFAPDGSSGFGVTSPDALDGSYGLRVFVRSPPK